ncbi:MAG: serine protease [Planctomycetota bacterium]|nr:serine protease [Planctomycetota bacterium]
MQRFYVALLVFLALVSGCAMEPPIRPESPVEVLASTSNSRHEWDKIAAENQSSVVALVVERGVFESAPNYGAKMWASTKSILFNPFIGVPNLVWNLLFGYLDLAFAEGTGFIISDSGYVLTNAHVVESGQRFITKLNTDKKWRKAILIASSPNHDLALLKIVPRGDNKETFRAVQFQEPKKLGAGVAVLGFPSPLWSTNEYPLTMTQGIISCLDLKSNEVARRFQTDAATNRGASGSPVLNKSGAVLGIVAEHARPALLEDQTFAIPSSEIAKAGFIKFKPPVKTAPKGQ